MLPWRLPVWSLSTPGGVRVCARTLFWHLAPLFPLCLVGRLNVCFRQLGMGAPSLSCGPKLLCFALLVRECRVVPRVLSAEGSGGVEKGMRPQQLCVALLAFPSPSLSHCLLPASETPLPE